MILIQIMMSTILKSDLNYTTGIVLSDDDYSCGAASFATVLNNLGINMTLDEAML